MSLLSRLHHRYILSRYPVPHSLWQDVIGKIAIVQHLSPVELAHLRVLSTLFLHQKTIIGAAGLEISDKMKLCIAIQSCLLILHLDIHYFSGWIQITVYPDKFKISRDNMDEIGIVHHETQILLGESWSKGPVILSWSTIEQDLRSPFDGHNIIIHEMAHKLDMLNGPADGLPPLTSRLQVHEWITDLGEVYAHLHNNLEHHYPCKINDYAATSPGEFFAVVSEYFFSAPAVLRHHFPTVYQHLKQFYQQDPILRSVHSAPE